MKYARAQHKNAPAFSTENARSGAPVWAFTEGEEYAEDAHGDVRVGYSAFSCEDREDGEFQVRLYFSRQGIILKGDFRLVIFEGELSEDAIGYDGEDLVIPTGEVEFYDF